MLQLVLWGILGVVLYLATDRYSEKTLTISITEEKEKPMEFPAVTICNNNRYRKSVIIQYDDIAQNNRPGPSGEEEGLNVSEIELSRQAAGMDYEEHLNNASQSLASFMLLCFFGRKKIPCETASTVSPTFYGYCYTFNSLDVITARGGPLLVKRPGNEHGFRLVAFLATSEGYSNEIDGVSDGVKVGSNSFARPNKYRV